MGRDKTYFCQLKTMTNNTSVCYVFPFCLFVNLYPHGCLYHYSWSYSLRRKTNPDMTQFPKIILFICKFLGAETPLSSVLSTLQANQQHLNNECVWQPTWEARIPVLNCGFFKVLNTGLILFPLKSIMIYHWLQDNVLLKSLPDSLPLCHLSIFAENDSREKDKTILGM